VLVCKREARAKLGVQLSLVKEDAEREKNVLTVSVGSTTDGVGAPV